MLPFAAVMAWQYSFIHLGQAASLLVSFPRTFEEKPADMLVLHPTRFLTPVLFELVTHFTLKTTYLDQRQHMTKILGSTAKLQKDTVEFCSHMTWSEPSDIDLMTRI